MLAPRTNRLLESLSPVSRDRLMASAKPIHLPLRFVLQEQEETPKYAYFVLSGFASVVIALAEGGSAEVSLIGNEGVTGALSLLGSSAPPSQCFTQMEGDAYRIPLADLKAAFLESEEIRTRILEFVQQQALSMSQLTACNKLHEAEPRLARWLLMVQDRVGGDVMNITQEFLAQMLGTRRTTVVMAAGMLQQVGLIQYSRGKVTIVSREKLEEAACDCYPVVRRLTDALYDKNRR